MRFGYASGCLLLVGSSVAVLLNPLIASAASFTLPLPGLTGSYSVSTVREAPVDFGFSFVSIDEVGIDWSGSLTPGLGQGDGVELPVEPSFPWLTQIRAFMDPPGFGMWHATVGPLGGSFAEEQPFSWSGPSGAATFDFLLDGTATVSSQLAPLIVIGGTAVVPPSGVITGASLVVVGTVPEPSAALLLAFGLAGLAVGVRRRLPAH
jgi:hypothetical protein